jgi:hypothetical protein
MRPIGVLDHRHDGLPIKIAIEVNAQQTHVPEIGRDEEVVRESSSLAPSTAFW